MYVDKTVSVYLLVKNVIIYEKFENNEYKLTNLSMYITQNIALALFNVIWAYCD